MLGSREHEDSQPPADRRLRMTTTASHTCFVDNILFYESVKFTIISSMVSRVTMCYLKVIIPDST